MVNGWKTPVTVRCVHTLCCTNRLHRALHGLPQANP